LMFIISMTIPFTFYKTKRKPFHENQVA
jgi:hypothetical protein